jgi:hypothetical protein
MITVAAMITQVAEVKIPVAAAILVAAVVILIVVAVVAGEGVTTVLVAAVATDLTAIPNLDGIVGARQAGALLSEQNKSSSGLPRPYTKVIFGITADLNSLLTIPQT